MGVPHRFLLLFILGTSRALGQAVTYYLEVTDNDGQITVNPDTSRSDGNYFQIMRHNPDEETAEEFPDCYDLSNGVACLEEDYCYWTGVETDKDRVDDPKGKCRPGVRAQVAEDGTPTDQSDNEMGALITMTEYPNGVALEIYPNDATYCKSFVNAPTANLWSKGTKAVLYFITLVYSFFGVAIVADIFMSAIEVITSQEVDVAEKDKDGNDVIVRVRVWNDTVANLTLLALGSSAPEILLATLETCGSLGEKAGVLGPSTIVGSAAFNLFMILAVCMVSVPAKTGDGPRDDSGIRKISQLGVFLITAFSSVFAYLWMFLCIVTLSYEEVEIWEATMTFMFFPILVVFAYLQDIHYFDAKCPCLCKGREEGGNFEKYEIAGVRPVQDPETTAKQLLASGKDVDDEAIARTIAKQAQELLSQQNKHSYMRYRVNAVRGISGKKRVLPNADAAAGDVELQQMAKPGYDKNMQSTIQLPDLPATDTTFEFNTLAYAVREDAGSLQVAVMRNGDRSKHHTVNYKTVDGTAKGGDENSAGDFDHQSGTLVFKENEHKKTIVIPIVEDEDVEEDEFFYVTLSNPTGPSVSLGAGIICTVKILDVSKPGRVGFKHKEKRCQESDGKVKLAVVRKEGAQGNFFVDFRTQDGTAIAGEDYEYKDGTLKFGPGEMQMNIFVKIKDNQEVSERHRSFECVLVNADNENHTAELIKERATIRVDISDDEQYSKVVNKFRDIWKKQKKQFSISTGTWKEQFEDAIEPPSFPTPLDFFLHGIAFPWKLIFAFIPPTEYYNGWLTFNISLAATGLVTFFIGEVAGTFGCMVGISEAIVAVSIVALGTSMPDTFASRTATMMAPDADAAVGNVTGSNSVNVFLGLGLPWLIASIYAKAADGPDGKYVVPEGTLVFAVMCFTPCALLCLGTLLLRRVYVGGELGGSPSGRIATAVMFVSLWVLFILLAILKDYEVIA